jgi:hypothetical protein
MAPFPLFYCSLTSVYILLLKSWRTVEYDKHYFGPSSRNIRPFVLVSKIYVSMSYINNHFRANLNCLPFLRRALVWWWCFLCSLWIMIYITFDSCTYFTWVNTCFGAMKWKVAKMCILISPCLSITPYNNKWRIAKQIFLKSDTDKVWQNPQ